MRKQTLIMIGLCVFLCAAGVGSAYAKITVDANFQGMLVISLPSGEVSILEPGDPVPDIPSGSMIESFDGTFTVKTDKGDQVQMSCLNHNVSAGEGSSVTMSCKEMSGSVKVESGTASLTDPSGQKTDLNAGTEYPIAQGAPKAEEAAPTGAGDGEVTGGAPAGGDLAEPPPVDSRNLRGDQGTGGAPADTRTQQSSPSE